MRAHDPKRDTLRLFTPCRIQTLERFGPSQKKPLSCLHHHPILAIPHPFPTSGFLHRPTWSSWLVHPDPLLTGSQNLRTGGGYQENAPSLFCRSPLSRLEPAAPELISSPSFALHCPLVALKGNWLWGLHPVFKALTLPRGFGALGCVSLSESLTHSLAPILTSRGLIPPWEGREEGRHLWKEVRWSWPWFLASRAPVLGRKNHIAERTQRSSLI